jgi:PAS domain S-box-containing protein
MILKIAMVGGGEFCLRLLRIFQPDPSRRRHRVEVLGVADPDPQVPGIREADRQGIFTTRNVKDLFILPGLHLILALTGDLEIVKEILEHKPESVGFLDRAASEFFQSIQDTLRIFEEKEDQYTLARSLALTLTKATNEVVMVLDMGYRIVQINQEACRQAGITEEEAQNRFCFQVTHQAATPCHSQETPCPMIESVETGRPAHAIHEHVNMDGQSHFCDVSTYPLVNSQGEVVQVLEICRDITNELARRMEDHTRAVKEDLSRLVMEDKLISLGKLVASVTHEINNPIGSILNFTKLILKTLRDHSPTRKELADFDKWLDLTVREAQRCGKIVKNLLSFARQQSMEPRRMNLNETLEQIILLTGHQMELGRVRLDITGLVAEPLEIWGDQAQIQQCFTNLFFNALEAMPGGGTLTLRSGKDSRIGEVWVEVCDTGEGIPPQVMPHIFEPFFSTKKDKSGVGLGLSMVYGIITSHHGRIKVESVPDQETTFRIVLPTAPPFENARRADSI